MLALLPRPRRFAPCAAVALACLLAASGHTWRGAKQDDKKDKQAEPRIVLSVSPFGQFGLQLLDRGQGKKITYNEEGGTNFTVVSVDGKNYLFGLEKDSPEAAKVPAGLLPGKWVKEPAVLKPGLSFQAVWSPTDKIEITHTLEIVRSKTGALDACLVRYTIENKDAKAHKVGVRLLLDTFIVDNDGHPFALPGKDKLITTSADYKKNVPAVIKALQKPDLKIPVWWPTCRSRSTAAWRSRSA